MRLLSTLLTRKNGIRTYRRCMILNRNILMPPKNKITKVFKAYVVSLLLENNYNCEKM